MNPIDLQILFQSGKLPQPLTPMCSNPFKDTASCYVVGTTCGKASNRSLSLQSGSCSQVEEDSLWMLWRCCTGMITLKMLPIIKIASPKGKETLMSVSYLETVGDTIKSYQKPASVHGTDTSGLKTTFTKNQISPRLPLP